MRIAKGIFTNCQCLEPTYLVRISGVGHQYFLKAPQVILCTARVENHCLNLTAVEKLTVSFQQ